MCLHVGEICRIKDLVIRLCCIEETTISDFVTIPRKLIIQSSLASGMLQFILSSFFLETKDLNRSAGYREEKCKAVHNIETNYVQTHIKKVYT